MANTSIDGLAQRSQKKRPVSHVQKSATKQLPAKVRKTPAYKKTSSQHTDPLMQKNERATSRPRHTLADSSSFVENNEADWSELLEAMGTTKETPEDEGLEERGIDHPITTEHHTPMENLYDDDDDFFDFDDELLREDRLSRVKASKKKKSRHLGRNIALVFVAVLVILAGVLYFWGDSLISRLTGGNSGLWSTLSAMISKEIPFNTDENGRTNVLVFGTEGYNMAGETADGMHDGAQLTDSIMVISFDQATKDVALLSLPRDLKVPMACSAGKINEVFWCNNRSGKDDVAGANALMQQISQVLNIEFQYYAHVNWASLIDIVDTIGGITITLDEDINDVNFTGAVGRAGETLTLNGEQALGFARARHGTVGGDFTRGNTQQKIVSGIVEKILSTDLSMNTALNLLNILGDNLRTNFSTDNIKAGIRLASGFNVDNIRQVPLVDYEKNKYYVTSTTIDSISYVVPAAGVGNYDEIHEYVAKMFSSDVMKREYATVVVLNATGEYGVASAEREALIEAGYRVNEVGDAPAEACDKATCVILRNGSAPETAKSLAQRYGVEVMEMTELPEGVEVNQTVDIIVIIGQINRQDESSR